MSIKQKFLAILAASTFLGFGSVSAQTYTVQHLADNTWNAPAGAQGQGQSFTTVAAGTLTTIEIGTINGTATCTLNVYLGDGAGGTLVHTQLGIATSAGVGLTTTIALTTPPSLLAATQYTFVLTYSAGSDLFRALNGGTYAGGQGWYGSPLGAVGSQDMHFRVTIVAPTPAPTPSTPVVEEPVAETVTETTTKKTPNGGYVGGLTSRVRKFARANGGGQ